MPAISSAKAKSPSGPLGHASIILKWQLKDKDIVEAALAAIPAVLHVGVTNAHMRIAGNPFSV
jgi:hypothetical protein